jgi:hypothetical protein
MYISYLHIYNKKEAQIPYCLIPFITVNHPRLKQGKQWKIIMSFFRPYYDICIVNKLNKMEYFQDRNIRNIFFGQCCGECCTKCSVEILRNKIVVFSKRLV